MDGELTTANPNEMDGWEGYIRESGVESAILEYGKRWYEFQQWCKENHGKSGGSLFAQFAWDRFGMKQPTAAMWSKIGNHQGELIDIINKFAPDYRAIYDYTRLEPSQQQDLLKEVDGSEKRIDQKRIKDVTYNHKEGDEWYTPRWLFDSLGIRYSIDVCAPADLTHVTTPADQYFSEAEDGLSQQWHGTIWCNPPYSTPAPWAARCVEHGDAMLLTHIPMNADWCMSVWKACDGIRLFQAMEFVRPDGKTQRPGNWLQLTAFGKVATEALEQLVIPDEVAENPRRVASPMWRKA